MNQTILKSICAFALLSSSACVTPIAGGPWGLSRVSLAQPLERNETQVRTQVVSAKSATTTSSHLIGVQYGVLDNLTLSVTEGESLQRLSDSSNEAGEEVVSIGAIYDPGLSMGPVRTSAELQLILKDDTFGGNSSGVEYRPSIAAYGDSFIGRLGVNLQDKLDAQVQVEGAYWMPIGDYVVGLLELDAGFGDIDEIYITPGVVTQLRELVQLQLSFPIGLNQDASDWQSLLGLSFRF